MMARKGTLRVACALIALMAAAGMLSGLSALLMVAPFLLLFGLLLAGLYPGERIIEVVAELIAARPRARRQLVSALTGRLWFGAQVLAPGPSGSRAPPRFA